MTSFNPISGILLLMACATVVACHTNIVHNVPQSVVDNQALPEPEKKRAIVLLHGIWSDASSLQETRAKLASKLRHIIPRSISLISLTEEKTSSKTILQQAASLKEALLVRGMGRDYYELIILGQSQGGLRGYELYRNFNQEFDIKGLITIGTPWAGAPAAIITKDRIKTYLNSPWLSTCRAGVSYIYPSAKNWPEFIDTVLDCYLPPTHEPGVQDLVPQSPFLDSVAASLFNSQLPILAIAGSYGNIRKILPISYRRYLYLLPVNYIFTYMLTWQIGQKHDVMIPVDSQLAKNLPKNDRFETYLVPDAIHDLLPGLEIPKNKVTYNHESAIDQCVEFIAKQFSL